MNKRSVFALVVTALMAVPALPQIVPLDTPASSPLWWPLADSISAAELRLAHVDRAANQQRYQAAVNARVVEVPPEEKLKTALVYWNNSLWPELTPISYPMSAFLQSHLQRKADHVLRLELRTAGVSTEGQQAILTAGRSFSEAVLPLLEEKGRKHRELMPLLRAEAEKRGGDERSRRLVTDAMKRRDHRILRDSGRSEAELQELFASLDDRPDLEGIAACLTELKNALSTADWDGFRSYLKTVVLVRMSQSIGEFEGD